MRVLQRRLSAEGRLAITAARLPRWRPHGLRWTASLAPPRAEEGLASAATAAWSADDDDRQAERSRSAKSAVQREATDAVMRAFFGCGEGGGGGEEGGGGGGVGVGGGGSRATVVLPGGAGKTVLALRVAEAMHARGALSSVLVLAPSLALVTQTAEEWKAWGSTGAMGGRMLAVCSDAEGADVTTCAGEVEAFLAEAAASATPALIVGTYASHERVAEALARSGRRLDLLICDEAHRTKPYP